MRNHWKIPKPQMFQHGPESETKGETEWKKPEGGWGRKEEAEKPRAVQRTLQVFPSSFPLTDSPPDSVFPLSASTWSDLGFSCRKRPGQTAY